MPQWCYFQTLLTILSYLRISGELNIIMLLLNFLSSTLDGWIEKNIDVAKSDYVCLLKLL